MKKRRLMFLTFVILLSFFFQSFSGIDTNITAEAAKTGNLELTFDENIDEIKFKPIVKDKWGVPVIEFWHHSGGYWSDGKGAGGLKINDSELEDNIPYNLEKVAMSKMKAKNGYKLDERQLPEEVKKALNEGKDVIVQVESRDGAPIGNFFHNIDDLSKHSLKLSGDKMEFTTYPKFEYQRNNMDDIEYLNNFGYDLHSKFPYVKEGHGALGWSIWPRSGSRPGEWSSYTYWNEWIGNSPNKISPDKLNKDGTLKPGYTIDTTRGNTLSNTMRVGASGVFNSAGAFALHFAYPIKYNFYVKEEGKIIEDVILTEMKLFEKGNSTPITTFERTFDSKDPLNPEKQKVIMPTKNPREAVVIDEEKEYFVEAKYMFVSFKEGGFDTEHPELMSTLQRALSTVLDKNELLRTESYDEKVFLDGVYDLEEIKKGDRNPYVRLFNLNEETFSWDLEDLDKFNKYVKIGGLIPKDLFPKEKNENPNNDWGVLYARKNLDEVDIGTSDLKLYDSNGREVDFIEPNKRYTADVVVNHLEGDEVVGTDSVKNPKPIVNYKVVEIGNNVIMENDSKQTNRILKPKENVKMPRSSSFTSSEGFVRVCGTIAKTHHDLGYNYDLTNDDVCKDFGMIKNYSVLGFESTPSGVNLNKNETRLRNHPVSFKFKVGNETHNGVSDKLPSSVPVEIRNNGRVIWNRNISVAPGEAKEFIATVGVDLNHGDNNFLVEVNKSRNQKEFKPGMSDPYSDNIKSLSIKGTRYQECQECFTRGKNTKNDWKEEWRWHEQRGNVRSSSYEKCTKREQRTGSRCTDRERVCTITPSGRERCRRKCVSWRDYNYTVCVNWETVPYEYCSVTYSNSKRETINYYEEYKINKVEFGSKYNEDTKGRRMQEIRDGGEAGIKAGYGFELEIETIYKTNRGVAPLPSPYQGDRYRGDKYGRYGSGYCDFITRYPGVTPVYAPRYIYVEMPYVDRSGKKVCYILNEYKDKGSWDNLSRTFMLPERKSPTGKTQRRIYINEDAQPNNKTNKKLHPIKIITPRPDKPDRFYGYEPENQVGNKKRRPSSYLHDCHTIYVVIYPNDDIKSHIIQ